MIESCVNQLKFVVFESFRQVAESKSWTPTLNLGHICRQDLRRVNYIRLLGLIDVPRSNYIIGKPSNLMSLFLGPILSRRQEVRPARLHTNTWSEAGRGQPRRVPLDLPHPDRHQRLRRRLRHRPGDHRERHQRWHSEGHHSGPQVGKLEEERVRNGSLHDHLQGFTFNLELEFTLRY